MNDYSFYSCGGHCSRHSRSASLDRKWAMWTLAMAAWQFKLKFNNNMQTSNGIPEG